jgi:hypothetical protein
MKNEFVFGKKNYVLMIAGLVIIAIGYMLMAGGGSDDPSVFNPDIFGTQRIIVAPIVVLAGFIVELWAIMSKPE